MVADEVILNLADVLALHEALKKCEPRKVPVEEWATRPSFLKWLRETNPSPEDDLLYGNGKPMPQGVLHVDGSE